MRAFAGRGVTANGGHRRVPSGPLPRSVSHICLPFGGTRPLRPDRPVARSPARALGSRTITFTAAAPGFVDTAMTQVLTDEPRAGIVGQVPLGRYAQPAEIAAPVSGRASDDTACITGAVIPVD
ncbi:hypothetical protein CLM83_12270, partial [Streptomyces albidoflavus]